jgi:mannose-1-phosphate guanylyltransferase
VVGEWTRVEGGDSGGSGEAAAYPLRGPKHDIVTILGEDVFVDREVVVRNCVVLPHKELRASVRNEIIM